MKTVTRPQMMHMMRTRLPSLAKVKTEMNPSAVTRPPTMHMMWMRLLSSLLAKIRWK
jgi:hypothetical protein